MLHWVRGSRYFHVLTPSEIVLKLWTLSPEKSPCKCIPPTISEKVHRLHKAQLRACGLDELHGHFQLSGLRIADLMLPSVHTPTLPHVRAQRVRGEFKNLIRRTEI